MCARARIRDLPTHPRFGRKVRIVPGDLNGACAEHLADARPRLALPFKPRDVGVPDRVERHAARHVLPRHEATRRLIRFAALRFQREHRAPELLVHLAMGGALTRCEQMGGSAWLERAQHRNEPHDVADGSDFRQAYARR